MGRKKTKPAVPTPFGQRLSELRLKKGISKDALSQGAAVSVTYINLLENGERQPSREVVLRLGKTLLPEARPPQLDELLLLAGYSPLSPLQPEHTEDPVEACERSLAEDGGNFKAFSGLVMALLRQDRHEEALRRLQQGFEAFSERAQLQSLLALLELGKGRCDDAIMTQELAVGLLRSQPDREPGIRLADALLNLGTMHFIRACEGAGQPESRDDLSAACELLAEAAALAPDDVYLLDELARARFNLALALEGEAAAQQWQATVAAFQAVLASESKALLGQAVLREATAFLALALAKTGRHAEAELSLQVLGAFCPDYWLLYYIEACRLCLRHASEPDAALLERALNQLARSLACPDPHNRSRREAAADPDLAPLRQVHAAAFQALIQSLEEMPV